MHIKAVAHQLQDQTLSRQRLAAWEYSFSYLSKSPLIEAGRINPRARQMECRATQSAGIDADIVAELTERAFVKTITAGNRIAANVN